MKLFLTSYSMGGAHYGAYVQASSKAQAERLIGERRLNERLQGEIASAAMPHRLADLIEDEQWVEAAHEAAFLGFVGLQSGALSPREVLGDTGLVHELLHLARPLVHHPDEDPAIVAEDVAARQKAIQIVRKMACDFEYRVPGHAPSFAPPHQL